MKYSPYLHLKHYVILSFSTFLFLATSFAKDPEVGSMDYRLKAAETIDRLLAQTFKDKKITAPKFIGDEKFLRRSYLVLAGRIPTLEEVKQFTADRNPYKRDLLAQKLLHSPGYKSHMTNYFFDLLRAQERFTNRSSAAPYQAWIREAVHSNKKWHTLVSELIQANGSIWNNGAVGYYIRDKGMELDNLSNSMRLFTGTRMECAQCHDHPYNDTERMDFYRLAAFSSGYSSQNSSLFYQLQKQLDTPGQRRSSYQNFVRFMRDNIPYSSRLGDGVGRIKLPYDYQYNDGDPHELVGARTPFGKTVRMSDRRDGDDGIERFTEWMTTENKRFASVIANRMWKRIMGTGLYEPEDEWVESDKTISPELMEFLVKTMVEIDYDLKEFQNILLLTKIYTFETSNQAIRTKFYNQQGRQLQRLTAEQIWDSFVTLKTGNPDKLPTRQYPKTLRYGGKLIGSGEKNMSQIASDIAKIKEVGKLNTYLKDLHDSLGSTKASPMMMRDYSTQALTGFVRASEIASPAPNGHMLREFGQSDRELIQNSTSEPNVNQVLSILNGHVEKLIVSDKNAHIHKAVIKGNSAEDNIRNLFLATLTREPSKVETLVFKEEVAQSGEAGYKNILAALLTSREFLFLQ